MPRENITSGGGDSSKEEAGDEKQLPERKNEQKAREIFLGGPAVCKAFLQEILAETEAILLQPGVYKKPDIQLLNIWFTLRYLHKFLSSQEAAELYPHTPAFLDAVQLALHAVTAVSKEVTKYVDEQALLAKEAQEKKPWNRFKKSIKTAFKTVLFGGYIVGKSVTETVGGKLQEWREKRRRLVPALAALALITLVIAASPGLFLPDRDAAQASTTIAYASEAEPVQVITDDNGVDVPVVESITAEVAEESETKSEESGDEPLALVRKISVVNNQAQTEENPQEKTLANRPQLVRIISKMEMPELEQGNEKQGAQATGEITTILDGVEKTSINRHEAIQTPIFSQPGDRSPGAFGDAVAYLDIVNNPRFQPEIALDGSINATYCNIFFKDFLRAMGIEVPYFYDINGDGNLKAMTANRLYDWLQNPDQGGENGAGFVEITLEEGIALAQLGVPVVVAQHGGSYNNGHLAFLSPDSTDSEAKVTSVGRHNTTSAPFESIFPGNPVKFFAYDVDIEEYGQNTLSSLTTYGN